MPYRSRSLLTHLFKLPPGALHSASPRSVLKLPHKATVYVQLYEPAVAVDVLPQFLALRRKLVRRMLGFAVACCAGSLIKLRRRCDQEASTGHSWNNMARLVAWVTHGSWDGGCSASQSRVAPEAGAAVRSRSLNGLCMEQCDSTCRIDYACKLGRWMSGKMVRRCDEWNRVTRTVNYVPEEAFAMYLFLLAIMQV